MSIIPADAPVGVFDSGVGGISVLRAIRQELPREHLLYAADSGHAPYGDRDAPFIRARVDAMTRFLLAQGAKAIVIACNTATVVAARDLRGWCPVPVVAMEPAIKPASQSTQSGVVGVLATSQTIASESVARLCESHGQHVRYLLQPCPGLVERVEQADLGSDTTRALLAGYIVPLLQQGADTLVLGCTHYPFLTALIQDIAGPSVTVIDPASAVAREVARRLGSAHRPQASAADATTRFYTTSDAKTAQSVMSSLWGEQVLVQDLNCA